MSQRLHYDEVQTIFGCIDNNERPPNHLKFKIIVSPLNESKLSPPSFEFQPGIYVLLFPTSCTESATVPSALDDVVLSQRDLSAMPPSPWSISGPQGSNFNTVTFRYVYPRGSQAYSSQMTGLLWTRQELAAPRCTHIRILHVFHSSKKAKAKREDSHNLRPKKKAKKSSKAVVNADDVNLYPGLLSGEMVATPVTLSGYETTIDLDMIRPESLFDLDDDPFSFTGNDPKSVQPAPYHPFYPPPPPDHAQTYSYGYGYPCPPSHNYEWSMMHPYPTSTNIDTYAQHHPVVSRNNSLDTSEFSKRLDDLHLSLQSEILSSECKTSQAHMLNCLQNWAKKVAKEPLQRPQEQMMEAKLESPDCGIAL